MSGSSTKREWIDAVLSDDPVGTAPMVGTVASTMEESQPHSIQSHSRLSSGGRMSSPARYRRPAAGANMSVASSSIRSSTMLAMHPTDDDDSNDDESALAYSHRGERYYSDTRSQGSQKEGCLSVTDRLWCETLRPCLGGSIHSQPTLARQQQQRTGRMELEHQQLQLKIQQLRLLNGKLHARNQILEHENTAALATAHQTTTTSDGTVTALQQRCHEAERKNVQLQTELDVVQGKAQVFEVTSSSLKQQLDELQQQRALSEHSVPAATTPRDDTDVTVHRDETTEQGSAFATAELRRLTMTLEESEKKLSFVQAELRQQQQEHVVAISKLQGDLERTQEQSLETEISLKAQMETMLAEATAQSSPTSVARSCIDTEATDLLNERDDTIATLRQQCLDYSQQLTLLQTRAVEATAALADVPPAQLGLVDLQRAKEEAERQVAALSDTIHELETNYGTMERQLLEAKLSVAAADEAKEQLTEEHESKLQAMEAEQDRLTKAYATMQNDKDRLVGDLTMQLETLQNSVKEFEAVASRQAESDGLIVELTLALETMKATKEELGRQVEFECSNRHNDSAKVLSLQTDVDDLTRRLDEQTKMQRHDNSHVLDELCQTVQRSKQSEEALQRQLTMALDESGASDRTRELEQELNERNATISQLSEQVAELTRQENSRPVVETRGMSDETEPSALDPAATSDEWSLQRIDEMSSKVKKLKKQLTITKNENARLRAQLVVKSKGQDLKLDGSSLDTDDTADDDSSTTTASSRRLLKERDDAIASLVKQVMAQDVLVTELRREIAMLNSEHVDRQTLESSSDITVQQLQKEADVFAGQVIELDGEIEQLKSALALQERKVMELESQIEESKGRQLAHSSILELEAEIDELKEANTTQHNELRELRRKAWEAESAGDEIVRLRNEALEATQTAESKKIALDTLDEERSKLQSDLELERTNKATLETHLLEQLAKLEKSCNERTATLQEKLDESRWAFDELKAAPGHMSEEAVLALREEITNLRHDLGSQTDEVNRAKRTVQELEEILAEKSSVELGAFEEEREDLLSEIESLTRQLEDARERIKVLETDVVIIDEFKAKLERADEAREESEKNIIDSYERKVSLLTLDKDVTIDKLRKELLLEKETNAEELREVTDQLKSYQLEISDLREEMAEQVSRRESRIFELEQILAAQEQLVTNMKIEMDHLQGSMEGSAARRKEENDEMQQELLSLTASTAKQEREIQSLQMELETKRLGHQSEVSKLESKITALEKNPQELRNAHDLQMELRVKEVKDRLEKLKWRNTSLKEENLNLRERLEQAEAIAKDSADHDRIKALETQLSKQMDKVKTLESQLKSLKEPPVLDKTTVSNSREPPSGSPPLVEPPVREPPVKVSATMPFSIERKTSSASPARTGGMLKMFGRKNATTAQSKPDAS